MVQTQYFKLEIPGILEAHDELSVGNRRIMARVANQNMGAQVVRGLIDLRLQEKGLGITTSKKSASTSERQAFRDETRKVFIANGRDLLADGAKRSVRSRTIAKANTVAETHRRDGLVIIRGMDLGRWVTSDQANPGSRWLKELTEAPDGPAVALVGGGAMPKVRPIPAETDLPESPRSIFQRFPGVLIMRYGSEAEHWGYPDLQVINYTPSPPVGQRSVNSQPSPQYPDVHQGYTRMPS